jgi:hypothetical protein
VHMFLGDEVDMPNLSSISKLANRVSVPAWLKKTLDKAS